MKIVFRKENENLSMKGAFEDFVVSQMAKGVSDKTVETYRSHFKSIGKYLDTEMTFGSVRQADLDRMIVSMRQNGLAQNSISSYLRFSISDSSKSVSESVFASSP